MTPEQLAALAEQRKVQGGIQQGLTDPIALSERNIGGRIYDTQGGFVRQEPKVATAETGVTTMGGDNLAFDPSNPKDYIFNINGKKLVGGNISQQEYVNYQKAQDILKEQANKQVKTPYGADNQYYQDILLRQQQAKSQEATNDAAVLAKYQDAKNLEYSTKIKQLEDMGRKQQEASQRVLSFSGVGRSSSAARMMSDIQGQTSTAVLNAQAARDAEIAKYQAELQGADSDTLKSLNAEIEKYNTAAQDRQLASIKSTAEANQKNAVSFDDALSNLGKVSAANGIDVGDEKTLAYYGSIVRNPDGTVSEEKLATLPENVQALIKLAAQTSSASTEAPKIQQIGKNQYGYFDSKGNLIKISGGTGGSSGGTGGGSAAAPLQNELINKLNVIKSAIEGNPLAPRSTILSDPEYSSALDYIKANMTFEKLQDMKKQGVKLGVLSDSDMRLLGQAALAITPGMKKDSVITEVNRLIKGVGGAATAPATPKVETTAPQKSVSGKEMVQINGQWFYK